MQLFATMKNVNFSEAFARFTSYQGKVKYWLTFNGINSAIMPMGGFLNLYVEKYDDGTDDFYGRKKKSFDWYRRVIKQMVRRLTK